VRIDVHVQPVVEASPDAGSTQRAHTPDSPVMPHRAELLRIRVTADVHPVNGTSDGAGPHGCSDAVRRFACAKQFGRRGSMPELAYEFF
jgi:hypothetical protein